jgi:hypothetical protein
VLVAKDTFLRLIGTTRIFMWYDLAKYIHNYIIKASEIYIINYVESLKHVTSQKTVFSFASNFPSRSESRSGILKGNYVY